MNIDLKEITVEEIFDGYLDDGEGGVVGYGGLLNIRPKFQREFVYNDKQRDAVIDTIRKGFPLNVMYWTKNEDGTFELLDGQQRTISFCQYRAGVFSIDYKYFHNLTTTEQDQIKKYKLMIYICDGNDKDKLDWFKTINIAGEELTNQELRNAIYTGEWLTNAKSYFSKTSCPAYNIGKDYLNGTCIRQDYLETVLKWISDRDGVALEEYMGIHQHDENASPLWQYFQSVINWVKVIYPNYRKKMRGVAWGVLYNKYKDKSVNADELEKEVARLMLDDDVSDKSGIYEYLLDGDEKHLNIRAFTENMKIEAYEKQSGICPMCKNHFEIDEMEADHIDPWHAGGKTVSENCQMLCKSCNRRKSGI